MAETLTIACALPHGVVIHEEREDTYQEPILGGGTRDVKRFLPTGRTATVQGVARDLSKPSDVRIEGAYALTYGVDADLWEGWAKTRRDLPMFKNGLIFATAKANDVHAKAREAGNVRTGFEPIDPSAPSMGLAIKAA
jgi:hypothetical protein